MNSASTVTIVKKPALELKYPVCPNVTPGTTSTDKTYAGAAKAASRADWLLIHLSRPELLGSVGMLREVQLQASLSFIRHRANRKRAIGEHYHGR